MTLTPAYGRDYKNRAQIIADLNAGKDFMAHSYDGSGYINLPQMDDGQYQVRDASQRKLWIVNVKNHVAK
jgi:hypothetical protein